METTSNKSLDCSLTTDVIAGSPTSVTYSTNDSVDKTSTSSSDTTESSQADLVKDNQLLNECVARLEKEVARLEANNNHEIFANQVETLEKSVEKYKTEAERLKRTAEQFSEQCNQRIQQLKEEHDAKIEKLTQQVAQTSKERESMVMKYAVSENNVLVLQKQIKVLEIKMKDQQKEKEGVEGKLKIVVADKVRLSQQIDQKLTEIQALEREVSKRKDEINSQSSNLKFFQNKLMLELESHKETQQKLERTTRELRDAREETEQVRRDAQEMLRRYEEEGRKALGVQDLEELEEWKQKHRDLVQENHQLCIKVQTLERERLDYEQNLSKAKLSANVYEQTVLDLQAATGELESTKLLLSREQEKLAGKEAEVERLKQASVEMQQEMETCRCREAELLTFTQKLTEKNVVIQSELTGLETRAQLVDSQYAICKKNLETIAEELAMLKSKFGKEESEWREEKNTLSRQLAEKTEAAQKFAQQLEDQIGENQLLKKKHMGAMKELTREVQSLRKRGEAAETISLGRGSHTSSNTSLNNLDSEVKPELDRQVLIEKIVEVQRSNARKQEKIEFLEEHSQQLTAELQKKKKIVQSLIMRQQTGAIAPESVDENKAALAKHGGIMASVYNSKAVDDTMTLELSLEINQKLQAVLEDTLLKNITLKENMETLGAEIERLTARRLPDPT